jgi:plasmid maintenance system antidote protein VapI
MSTKPSRNVSVAEYLAFHLDASNRTQREIANEIGYTNANVITMFKQGLTKVPPHVAPKLAKALGLDPAMFLRMVLQEYMPELLEVVERQVGGLCSQNEFQMLKVIRSATKNADPVMTKEQERKLVVWAKDLA